MSLRQILQRRDEIRTELSGMLEQYPLGDMPDEQRSRADGLEAEATRLNDAERRQALADELCRRADGKPLDGSGGGTARREVRMCDRTAYAPQDFDGQVWRAADGSAIPVLETRHRLCDFIAPESPEQRIGLGGFLRALKYGPRTDMERRALGEASIGTGGAFLPTPLSLQVIDLLRPATRAFQAGARTIPMASQTLRFARQMVDPIGGWRVENSPITQSQPVFDDLTLTAKSWALLVPISRELLEDAQNIDQQLEVAFAKSAALALDGAILSGSGVPPVPLGIANTNGIQNIVPSPAAGAPLGNWQPVLDAVAELETANVNTVSALILHPRTAREINGWVDSLGQPLRVPPRLQDIPILPTTAMSVAETQGTSSAASSILLGDFSEVFVGIRTQLQVTVLHELLAANGQIGFVLWLRADVALAHPAALARIAGLT